MFTRPDSMYVFYYIALKIRCQVIRYCGSQSSLRESPDLTFQLVLHHSILYNSNKNPSSFDISQQKEGKTPISLILQTAGAVTELV